jgi:TolB-like protein/DNA-binding winged helix-turn-helix (wHTH) protein
MVREQGLYQFGPFVLDPARRALSRDGIRIKLPERLFDALLYLVVNQGRLVERDELVQAVWTDRAVGESNLGQAIFALRKVLKASGGADSYIITVPSRGFRFAEPVRFEAAQPESGQDSAIPPDPPAPAAWRNRAALLAATFLLMLAATGTILWRNVAPDRPGIPPPAAKLFAPPAHSVAVLAFDNLSGDPAQVYFSDGLSEQLIDSLTRIDAIQVAGRISSFSFRGSHATIGDIARALNVSAVLEGSVRRTGTHVVITAQLTNALTGFNIWSKTYDRDQGDIIGVQTEIAKAVAQSLQVTLLGGEADKLTLGWTTNPAAYDVYLRAQQESRRANDEASHRAALADFDHAIALDPGFAKAYVGRSTELSNLAMMGNVGTAAAQHALINGALAATDRALALAPGLAQAHSSRAMDLNWGLLDHAGAAREIAQAQMLTPGNAAIEGNYANIELSLGHADLAVTAARRSALIDPLALHSWGQLARVLFMARRYDEALEALGHVAALAGGKMPVGYTGLKGGVLVAAGRLEEARRLCAAGANSDQLEVLALADHQLKRLADAQADVAKLIAMQGDAAAFSLAEIYAQAGDTKAALDSLDTAVRLRDPGLADIRLDPMLDPVRGEARFKQVLAQLSASDPH